MRQKLLFCIKGDCIYQQNQYSLNLFHHCIGGVNLKFTAEKSSSEVNSLKQQQSTQFSVI